MTSEHRIADNDFYSGIPRGRDFPKPYRSDGEKAKELAAIKILTSRLGLITEHSVMSVWSRTLHPSVQIPFSSSDLDELTYIYSFHKNLRHMGTYPDTQIFEDRLMTGQGFGDLIQGVDTYFKNGISLVWAELEKNGNKNAHYVIEACLAMAREAVRPTLVSDNFLVPNLYLSGESIQTQIDGVLFNSIPGSLSSYTDLIDRGMDYKFVSVKMMFRDKYTRTSNRLGKPRLADKVQSQQQMARHAMWLWGRGVRNNLFPSENIYIYLRGERGTKVYREQVDLDYFDMWTDSIEDKFSKWAKGDLDGADSKIDLLTNFWDPLDVHRQALVRIQRVESNRRQQFIDSMPLNSEPHYQLGLTNTEQS